MPTGMYSTEEGTNIHLHLRFVIFFMFERLHESVVGKF